MSRGFRISEGHLRTGLRNGEAESGVRLKLRVIEPAFEGGIEQGAGPFDFNAAALSGAAGDPAGVQQPAAALVFGHFLGEQLGVHAGMARHEGAPKQAEKVAVGWLMFISVPATLAV